MCVCTRAHAQARQRESWRGGAVVLEMSSVNMSYSTVYAGISESWNSLVNPFWLISKCLTIKCQKMSSNAILLKLIRGSWSYFLDHRNETLRIHHFNSGIFLPANNFVYRTHWNTDWDLLVYLGDKGTVSLLYWRATKKNSQKESLKKPQMPPVARYW